MVIAAKDLRVDWCWMLFSDVPCVVKVCSRIHTEGGMELVCLFGLCCRCGLSSGYKQRRERCEAVKAVSCETL